MKIVLILLSLVLAGCQVFSKPDTHVSSTPSVMSLWDLYRDCQRSGGVEDAVLAAQRLRQSADTHVVPTADLPGGLDRLVRKQPVRTTVDPRAMAASCTLQAARASLDAGRHKVAEQLLRTLVRSYPETEYVFYVEQAKLWMKEIPPASDFESNLHSISSL
ncbi:MAG: hypothetical protein ABW047_07220 [Nitrospiraceae bacterium]